MADTPQRQETPQQTATPSPLKQGAAIGGWLCFGLGALIMYWSVWAFLLYVPLFFVAFVLSITAMAQRRIVLGIVLLLATIVVPLIEWFTLAAVRTTRFLDKIGAPRVNAFNRQPGTAFLTPPPSRAASPTVYFTSPQSQASVSNQHQLVEPAQTANDAEQQTRDRLLAEPLEKMHAWGMRVANSGLLAANPITPPAFSPDGGSVAFAQAINGSATLVVYRLRDHQPIKRWQPTAVPKMVAWSPDGERLAYRADDGLHISEISTGKDILLPIGGFGMPTEPLVWKSRDELIDLGDSIYTLDLDSLRVTRADYPRNMPDAADRRWAAFRLLFPSPRDHPLCKLEQILLNSGTLRYRGQISNPQFLFLSERDNSYAQALVENFDNASYFNSPDLHHILVAKDNSLLHLMLGPRPAPTLTYRINIRPRDFDRQNYYPFDKYLQLRVPFWAQVCSPVTNPLNGKLIGANVNDLKGRVRVIQWNEEYAIVRVALELKSFSEGDVVTGISSEQWNDPFGNAAYQLGDAWAPLNPAQEFLGRAQQGNVLRRMPQPTSGPEEAVVNRGSHESPTEGSRPVTEEAFPGEKFPQTRRQVLTENELTSWSTADIQYAINEIFARHQAEFPTQEISKNFAQFAWYHPQHGATFDKIEASLPPIERDNVQVLGAVRNARKSGSVTGQKQSAAADQQTVTPERARTMPSWKGPWSGTILTSPLRGGSITQLHCVIVLNIAGQPQTVHLSGQNYQFHGYPQNMRVSTVNVGRAEFVCSDPNSSREHKFTLLPLNGSQTASVLLQATDNGQIVFTGAGTLKQLSPRPR
jgi:hypothetical protein